MSTTSIEVWATDFHGHNIWNLSEIEWLEENLTLAGTLLGLGGVVSCNMQKIFLKSSPSTQFLATKMEWPKNGVETRAKRAHKLPEGQTEGV